MPTLKQIIIGLLYLFNILTSTHRLHAQVSNDDPLFNAIFTKDSLVFEVGFNACDKSGFEKALSDNFEFYHDKSGIIYGKEAFIASFSNNLCQPDRKILARRSLVEKSMKVYPLYDKGIIYGAIQHAEHKFYERIIGTGIEVATGIAKITHFWKMENGEWKLARALSYDHKEPLENKLDQLINNFVAKNAFNGCVLVAKNGDIVLEKGYGFRDAALKSNHDAQSIFVAYSITKSFTSTLILKLVEEGKLSLDDKLSKYFNSLPHAEKISIRHLLSHTSGLFNYTNGAPLASYDEKGMLDYLKNLPLDFEPGSKFNYSNTGYYLLGFIIMKATSLSYEEAMRKYILTPLGMTSSGFDFKNLKSDKKAVAYRHLDRDQMEKAEVYDSTKAYAAGALYSTVGDLYKFHKAMLQNKIIKEYHKLEAYTPIKDNYGFGWFTSQLGQYTVIGHNGGAAGFRSDLSCIESEGICVVLLNNMETDLNTLSSKLLMTALDLPIKTSKELPIETNKVKDYEGLYQVDKDNQFYIMAINGRLMVKPPNSLFFEATYLGNDNFYEELGGIEFSFLRNDSAKIMFMQFARKDGTIVKPIRVAQSWGITGSSTINGWNGPDIKFEPMPDKTLLLSNIKLNEGEIKFRLNNAWSVDLGKSNKPNILQYGGENIIVKKGTYDIRLAIDGMKNPTIEMIRKD